MKTVSSPRAGRTIKTAAAIATGIKIFHCEPNPRQPAASPGAKARIERHGYGITPPKVLSSGFSSP